MGSFVLATGRVCFSETRGLLTGFVVVLLAVAAGSGFADLGFGPPVPLSPNAGADGEDLDTEPVIGTDGVGTWIAAWHSWASDQSNIDVSRSTDDGATWSSPQTIDVYGGEDMDEVGHPQLATDGSGVWICLWQSQDELGLGAANGDTDLFFCRSTDNGTTWSEAAILNTNALADTKGDEYPHTVTDRAGNWVAVWRSDEDLGGTAGTDEDIVFARSTDNGVTWSDPALLHSFFETDVLTDRFPRVATDRAGRWVVFWDSYDPALCEIRLSYSDDSGATWSSPAPLPHDGADFRPDVASDGLGNWVVVWQSGEDDTSPVGTEYDLFASHSTDHGTSWSEPVVLNSTAWSDSFNDGFPRLTTDGLGNWLTIWQHYDILFSGGGGTLEVFVSRSQDIGVTWSPPESLNSDTKPINDVGGTDLETDGRGKWIAVWTSDDNIGGTIGTDDDILFSTSLHLSDSSMIEKKEWILYR